MDLDLLKIRESLTLEKILYFLEQYAALGPIPGFLLPFFEAFLPILPLFVFVMANAAAFGLWKGFLISWLGAVSGALTVYFIVRSFIKTRFVQKILQKENVKKLMLWVERHGFGPLFLTLCFPFSPSALINVVAALARVNVYQFVLAVILGKFVMIFTISWIGHDIVALIKEPLKTVMLTIFIFALWYVGKRIEIRMQVKGGDNVRKNEGDG